MRSKAWNFPSSNVMVAMTNNQYLFVSGIATFETTAVATLPKITSRIMHFLTSNFHPKVWSKPPPSSQSYTDPAALLRGYLKSKSSEADGNTAPNNDVSVRSKNLWDDGKVKRTYHQNQQVSFFCKVPVWNLIFFWGGCFYFFCDERLNLPIQFLRDQWWVSLCALIVLVDWRGPVNLVNQWMCSPPSGKWRFTRIPY